jgi:hypothetical protein
VNYPTLQLFIDPTGSVLRRRGFAERYYGSGRGPVFKRGATYQVEILFVEDDYTTPILLDPATVVSVALKGKGTFDTMQVLASAESTSIPTEADSPVILTLTVSSEALDDYLLSDGDDSNDLATAEAEFEIAWTEDAWVTQSASIDRILATINNNVLRGDEALPAPVMSAFDWRLDSVRNPSLFFLREDFSNNASIAPYIGELGWSEYGTGAGETLAAPTGTPPNIGLRRLTSGSTGTGNAKTLYLSRIVPLDDNDWDMCWVAALGQTTDCDLILGITNDNGSIGIGTFGNKCLGVRYSSAADTDFMFFSKNTTADWTANDANNHSVTSDLAVDTAFHTFRIRSISGVISMSVDGGDWVTVTNVLTGITQPLIPFAYIATRTAASKTADVDYFALTQHGLAR